MSSGLLALLDDIAAIVKVTAASLDDVATQAVKASSKAAGIVIDDTAVTPKYVVGLSPARELPIIWNIAKGSLRNKLLILLPAILLLGQIADWSIGPLLGVGGLFLCYEGYEKLHHAIVHMFHPPAPPDIEHAQIVTPEELEKERTTGAIRTDFILSAEIMAISYYQLMSQPFGIKIASLIAVAIVITAGVYGVVALILKADDVGIRLTRENHPAPVKTLGRLLITAMPKLLAVLSAVGTAAMLWVGGGIVIHSIPWLHHLQTGWLEQIAFTGVMHWLVEATISLVFGIVIGFIVVMLLKLLPKKVAKPEIRPTN
jgi:uncharacterized protein